jgi:hypothetical protein
MDGRLLAGAEMGIKDTDMLVLEENLMVARGRRHSI